MRKLLILLVLFMLRICAAGGIDSSLVTLKKYHQSKKTDASVYLAYITQFENQSRANNSKAVAYIDSAKSIAEKLQMPYLVANCYKIKGTYYNERNQHYLALDNYQKGYEVLLKNGMSDSTAEFLLKIGSTFFEHGLTAQAVSYYDKAYQLILKSNNIYLFNSYYTLQASVYVLGKEYDRASIYLDSAYNKIRITNDPYLIAQSFSKIAEIYLYKNQGIEALSYLNSALNTLLSSPMTGSASTQLLVDIYISTGMLFQKQGLYIDAMKNFRLARDVSESYLESRSLYVKSLYHISDLNFTENRLEESQTVATEALKYATLIQDLPQKRLIYQLLSDIFLKRSNYVDAIKYTKLAAVVTDSISSNKLASKFAEIRSLVEVTDRENKIISQEEKINSEETKSAFLIILVLLITCLFFIGYLYFRAQRKVNTELNAKNAMISEQQNQLQLLNATKDVFFSTIAHNLRNPFNALINISGAQLVEMQGKELGEIENYTKIINDSAKKGYKLLENLLLWSQSQTNSLSNIPQALNTAKIIELLIKEFQPLLINKKIQVQLHSDGSFIYADENMIKIIFRNLLSNAINYSHENGSIEVSVSRKADQVEIVFSDRGIGMSPEDQSKLFKIASSSIMIDSKGYTKGTGLGLILCKELLILNNGSLNLKSEIDQGSDFVVLLPCDSQLSQASYSITSSAQNEEIKLTEADKQYMHDWLNEFVTFEIYENTDLRRMLSKLEPNSNELNIWKIAMQDAIYLSDEIRFKKLLNIALN